MRRLRLGNLNLSLTEKFFQEEKKMKRFKVTNEMYKNGNVVEASRDNYAGDYVTAESEAEAIELYKDFLIEQIRNNNLNAEIVDDEIVVTDDEENEVERFINFEIED